MLLMLCGLYSNEVQNKKKRKKKKVKVATVLWKAHPWLSSQRFDFRDDLVWGESLRSLWGAGERHVLNNLKVASEDFSGSHIGRGKSFDMIWKVLRRVLQLLPRGALKTTSSIKGWTLCSSVPYRSVCSAQCKQRQHWKTNGGPKQEHEKVGCRTYIHTT